VGVTVPGTPVPLSSEQLEERYLAAGPAWCRANFVVTLDGAIEVEGRSGGLGDDDDRQIFVALRAVADVVLVGSGTARAEDYGPARPSLEVRQRRQARGQPPRPPIAVLTGTASLDPAGRLFTGGEGGGVRPIVLTAGAADADRRSALAAVADVGVCGDEEPDLGVALDALRTRGHGHILCEGGPTIVTRLLAGGLLDELCVSHAPVVAGPGHGLLVAGPPLEDPVAARRTDLLTGDRLLFARYRLGAGEG
jgi:riboflavin biosynthesis pyrimidine reductase